jgi:broad specificity phosphatase PhoE
VAYVVERSERRCDHARDVPARVDDCVERAPSQCSEIAVPVSPELFDVREKLGTRLSAVEQGHVVAARQRGLDDVAAEKLGAAEHEETHTLNSKLLWFVRHAPVEIHLEVPASQWRLTEDGILAAEELAERLAPVPRVLTSPEPKAVATAEPLARRSGVPVEQDERLREVERASNLADYDAHRAAVAAYLQGAEVPGWESSREALARFAAAIEPLDEVAVVTHATVLALFLGYDVERWGRIGLPDVIEWRSGE